MTEPDIPTIERVKSPFARGDSERSRKPSSGSGNLGSTRDTPPSAVGVEPSRSKPHSKALRVRAVRRLQGLRPMTGYEEQLIEEQSDFQNSAALCNALLARCLCRPGDAPGTKVERVGELLVAERDNSLVELRRITFGDQVDSEVSCPRCGVSVAFSFDLQCLKFEVSEVPEAIEIVLWDNRVAELRLPTARDQADLLSANLPSDAERRTWLLARSIQKLGDVAGPVTTELVHGLDSRTRIELESELEHAIPDFQLAATASCSACGHEFSTPFDVSSFFFAELRARAKALTREVHILAKCYHWEESTILGLTYSRRRRYLAVIDSEETSQILAGLFSGS